MTIVKIEMNPQRIINLFYSPWAPYITGLVFTPRVLISLFSEADSCFKGPI